MQDEVYDPSKIQVGEHPKHKALMAWKDKDNLGTHEITYFHGSMGGAGHHNYLMHDAGGNLVSTMSLDHDGRISSVETHPDLRRQGLATKLYKFASDIHNEIDSIPAPVHSSTKTTSGKAWADAVGGERVSEDQWHESHVPDEDFRSRRWEPIPGVDHHKLHEHLNEFVAKAHAAGLDEDTTHSVTQWHKTAKNNIDWAQQYPHDSDGYKIHMGRAHEAIDHMGEEVSDITHGELDAEHEALQEHIGRAY